MAAKAPPALAALATAHTNSAPTSSSQHNGNSSRNSNTPESRGMLVDVVMSVFEPGTNTGLIKAMNYSFYSLFATLLLMIYGTNGNVHVCALLLLSVGLFFSIKWFLVQVADVEDKLRLEREQEAARARTAEGKDKTE